MRLNKDFRVKKIDASNQGRAKHDKRERTTTGTAQHRICGYPRFLGQDGTTPLKATERDKTEYPPSELCLAPLITRSHSKICINSRPLFFLILLRDPLLTR